VSGFSGDGGDAIAAPVHPWRIANGMQFSCLGEDNDNNPGGQCQGGRSGWWFNWCDRAAINKDKNARWNAATDYARPYDVVSTRMLVKLD